MEFSPVGRRECGGIINKVCRRRHMLLQVDMLRAWGGVISPGGWRGSCIGTIIFSKSTVSYCFIP